MRETGFEAVGQRLFRETAVMMRRTKTKYVREGAYLAEVEVSPVEDDTGWSPYPSMEDARKLDDVKAALSRGDLDAAVRHARVYELRPVFPSVV